MKNFNLNTLLVNLLLYNSYLKYLFLKSKLFCFNINAHFGPKDVIFIGHIKIIILQLI